MLFLISCSAALHTIAQQVRFVVCSGEHGSRGAVQTKGSTSGTASLHWAGRAHAAAQPNEESSDNSAPVAAATAPSRVAAEEQPGPDGSHTTVADYSTETSRKVGTRQKEEKE